MKSPYKRIKHVRKCLKCLKEFKTIDPKHNRICQKCSKENLDEPREYNVVPPVPGHE